MKCKYSKNFDFYVDVVLNIPLTFLERKEKMNKENDTSTFISRSENHQDNTL